MNLAIHPVPFGHDAHAMVFSDNVPELATKLHSALLPVGTAR